MRVVAIDYGKVRIGIAITDMSKTIAYPLKTIKASYTLELTCKNILEGLKDHLKEIEMIIIGLPLLLNGKISQMAKEVQSIVEHLKKNIEIPIQFMDERLTSVMAEKHLKDTLLLNRKKRSKKIDQGS